MQFRDLSAILGDAAGTVAPAIQLVVRHRGDLVVDGAWGWLDPEAKKHHVTSTTLFDMASVTKLFVVTTFMTLVEAGEVRVDDAVRTVLPELDGMRPIRPYEDPLGGPGWVTVANGGAVDAGGVTFRHLLTHTAGLPAWRPLFRQPSAEVAREMALATFFSYPTGTRVVYSDIGLILLGMAIERLTGEQLDAAVAERVTGRLGLEHTRYLPIGAGSPRLHDVAPTEFCRWRNRRIAGEVHDENAYRLNGVAGHAGIFSTARDVATLGQMVLSEGGALLSPDTVREMCRLQTAGLDSPRGLGFALWSPDPEASSSPFSPSAFGHTGFTGTSVWVDPERDLVVALLTNEVYNGRTDRRIGAFRVAVHRHVVEAIDRG